MTSANILLVIPCYRHGDALLAYFDKLCPALATAPVNMRLLPVDDGSPAIEQAWLASEVERRRRTHPFLQPLLALPTNHGKGHAIRSGWATAQNEQWLAFVDADGAVPAHEVCTLLGKASAATHPTVFAATRDAQSGRTVHRFWHRHLGSRLFNLWVRWQLPLSLKDTQCGLKVIPRSLHEHAPWHEREFSLDLEILLRARTLGLPVHLYPIDWEEKRGSSLGWRHTLALFTSVRRLRQNPP